LIEVIHKTKIYSALTSSGKTKYWRGFVVKDNDTYYLQSEYWQNDGKHILSALTLVQPKNVGKANETTPKDQALLELNSIIKKKEDSGYGLNNVFVNIRPLPMLAHSFKKRGKDLKYPCYGQYKYDGCRALFSDGEFYSRKNKNFISACVKHLTDILDIPKKIILDGELMLANKSFDDSIEAIKKYRPGISENLFYYIYDIIDEKLPFQKRHEYLQKNIKKYETKGNIILAPTVLINDSSELDIFYKDCLKLGYEGSILRNAAGLYKINHRSADLLKYKPLQDAEFKILGAEEGKGRNKGCIIWLIETKNSTVTRCPQQGSLENSKKLFKNYKDFIGKKITVEFQDYTPDGRLRFPTAKIIRDYE
jgi:DNA ligase-1